MRYASGPPRKLSDRQIRAVLTWYETAENFRRRHGTARDLAALLGVSSHAVEGLLNSLTALGTWHLLYQKFDVDDPGF